MDKKLIGHCPVDSGQLIIIDPCYLAEWKDGEYNDKDSHYGKVCDITLGKESAGEILVSNIAGNGVAFASGYGDGHYPVYAHYNNENRIVKIEIIMK